MHACVCVFKKANWGRFFIHFLKLISVTDNSLQTTPGNFTERHNEGDNSIFLAPLESYQFHTYSNDVNNININEYTYPDFSCEMLNINKYVMVLFGITEGEECYLHFCGFIFGLFSPPSRSPK